MTDNPFVTPYGGHSPIIAEDAFVDVSARLIGRVKLMPGSSVWPGAVLRADDDEIIIGKKSAVLDQCLVEAPEGRPVIVHDGALISHMVCLHGAEVESGALVGVGAIVLDGAKISTGALVGAGALVPPGMVVPSGVLVLGQPAKVIRDLKPAEVQNIQDQLNELAEKSVIYRAG